MILMGQLGQIHYSGHWKGWALKISTFLGPNSTRFARGHFRAQKSLDFQGPPLPMALKMDFPPMKIITRHINNGYINTVVKI
jgi:hypothetical protein